MENSKTSKAKIGELIGRVREDMVSLRESLDITITDEYETSLLSDLEMFLMEDIAREIRISLYNPEESNKVYIEFRYIPGALTPDSLGQERLIGRRDIPPSCMFDVFLYYSPWFSRLEPLECQDLLKNCAIDWFNMDIDLSYKNGKSKKTEPKRQERPLPGGGKSMADSDTLFSELKRGVEEGQKLFFIVYRDLERATESIAALIKERGKIPVSWSLSRGFFPSVDPLDPEIDAVNREYLTREPGTALGFIVDNEEEQVSYLFEDFHHHFDSSSAGTHTAEIRSRIRDLARALKERDEMVFFLSPKDSLPVELVPLFFPARQGGGLSAASLLNRYGYDMTEEMKSRGSKPLIGRENKRRRVIQTLCQLETNNPILVGEPGVGKTAIVEALAQDLAAGRVPEMLQGHKIFSLNLNTLVAGSKYRGDFEERIVGLLEEVKAHKGKLIVFIDEIHTLLGTGSTEGSSGAEDVLKPALARGDFPCIGATTYEGYEVLRQDPALARRFKKIEVPPASDQESKDILLGIKSVFEDHHGVTIRDEAISTAIRLSNEYMEEQFLPGKAIKLLDSASALVKLEGRDTILGRDVEAEIAQCAAP